MDMEEERKNYAKRMEKTKRKYPGLAKLINYYFSSKNFFKTIEGISNKEFLVSDETEPKIIKEWIEFAIRDLRSANALFEKDPENTLYLLQQSVEKAIKAKLMVMRLYNEKDLGKREIGHNPHRFLLPLIENGILEKFYKDKFIKIKYDEKLDNKKINEFIHFLKSDEKEVLKKEEEIINDLLRAMEKIRYEMPDKKNIKKIVNQFIQKMTINSQEKKQINKDMEKVLKDEPQEMEKRVIEFIISFFAFIRIMVLMSTIIWIFNTTTRYPDGKRKLNIDFKNTTTYKNFPKIYRFIDEYLENELKIIEYL